MKTALLRALRVVRRADSHASRSLLFERLAARSRGIRAARWLTHGPLRGSLWSAALVVGYGLASARICLAAPAADIWALATYPNDRRQVDYVARCVDGGARIACSPVGTELARKALRREFWRGVAPGLRRLTRIARCLTRRNEFLVACRMTCALACALLARRALDGSGVRGVLVSSDYNAETVGLAWAARGLGVPTIFVSHAPPHELSPPLDFTLAILDGNAAIETYQAKGSIGANWVFKGVEGETRPLDLAALGRSRPSIGFFMPKEVLWAGLDRMISEALQRFEPTRILIRWHPNMMEPRPGVDWQHRARVEDGATHTTPAEEAVRCDWVVADENSSVQLAVLKAGVPVVPVRGLALVPEEDADLYGLVRDGLVPPPLTSLVDFDPGWLAAFYAAGWRERMARQDGAFLRSRAVVDRDVREAVLEALENRP
jgi:hypothetical protein